MSSIAVREAIIEYLDESLEDETIIDLTAQFHTLDELIAKTGLSPDDPWVGVQFIGNDEEPITIPGTPTQGKYRETGVVYVHVVSVARLGAGNGLLTRGEAIRDLLRGRRIDNRVKILSMTPMNFDAGTTLRFEGGYMSGSFIVEYEYDIDL